MSNGRQLYTFTPESFYQLDGMTPLRANLLALIAAFGKEGLRLSNYRLAKLFNVERGTIIDNIAILKGKRYITDEGENKRKHRLIASSVILTLLGSVKTTPKVVSKSYKTSVKTTPISKESKENRSDATPLPAGGQASRLLQDRKAGQQSQIEKFKRSFGKPVDTTLSSKQFDERKQKVLAGLRSSEQIKK